MRSSQYRASSVRAARLCGLLLAFAPIAAMGDTIKLVSGREMPDVEVKDAKWDKVTYTLTPKEGKTPPKVSPLQSVEGWLVLSIDRTSPRLSAAKGALETGDLAKAEQALDGFTTGQDWEKAEAAYLRGVLYLEWSGRNPAQLAKAINAFEGYLTAYKDPKDFYVPFATYGLGKAYLADGKAKEATEQFKALATFAGPKDKEKNIWILRGKIGEAWATLKDKGRVGSATARRMFGEIMADRTNPPDAQQEAAVGQAAALVVDEQVDQAVKLLNQAFFDSSKVAYNEYYGQACNLMGDAARAKKNLQDAEIWYLRATCFFKRFPRVYQEAARGLVEVYKELGMNDRVKQWEGALRGA